MYNKLRNTDTNEQYFISTCNYNQYSLQIIIQDNVRINTYSYQIFNYLRLNVVSNPGVSKPIHHIQSNAAINQLIIRSQHVTKQIIFVVTTVHL